MPSAPNVTVVTVLHLVDSATGALRPLETREEGVVSMYVCGPTVYGPPHLGHGRFSLVFDVLRRYLEWSGLRVEHVSNITDIDDKIIERSQREGRPWQEVTAEYEAVWWEAMDAVGVARPTSTPHATEYVEEMVEAIGRMVDGGAAYVAEDGVYFRPSTVDDYGLLARQSIDSLRAGARVDVDEAKESPIDFALWKFAKPGEPSWPSPWGEGRPGWHTECVVMALDLLGEGFDLHGGGQDLRFPHHENERAQAVALGKDFARLWAHNGFVEVAGEKMSKSLGNFTDLLDLIEKVDPRAYRMLCLQAHYRSPIDVNGTTIGAAEAALGRIDAVTRRLEGAELAAADPHQETLDRFRERMDDDLDTPGAMAVLFGAVTQVNSALDAGDVAGAAPVAAALGSMLEAVGLVARTDDDEIPAEVAALAAERDEARAAKDWARADELRDQLTADGWVVEDTPAGTAVRRA